jgi:hypothetical protein
MHLVRQNVRAIRVPVIQPSRAGAYSLLVRAPITASWRVKRNTKEAEAWNTYLRRDQPDSHQRADQGVLHYCSS